MESPVTGEGGSFVDAWYDISFKKLNVLNGLKGDMLNVTSLYFMSKFEFKSDAVISLFQPSVCAAGRSCSAGMESPRVASQVTTVPRTQTHSGLQECKRTHRQVCTGMQKSSQH